MATARVSAEEAAQTLNRILGPMSHSELGEVVSLLSVPLVQKLREHLQASSGSTDALRIGASSPADAGGGVSRGRPNDGKGGGGGYKGGGGGGGKARHSGKAGSAPVELTFQPEEVPPTTPGGEDVAFQGAMGTPWRLLGSRSDTFRWKLQDRGCVSDEEKAEIRGLLADYADANGIPLRGDHAVKLALRRGSFWVSYAGGISSADAGG
eukprot:TRINITY_DN56398_c0_g1_i1.p1 TRINITY_DN56398_c0_g1~~TRINITY_DN56398_c0_g1_i1.p1  ORF type:complete len:229 (-),score=48.26 TRINITY_DN56398_c0_g1_i1:92-718(-)